MKNLKISTLISLFLIIGMTTFTSCGKDTDVSDKDEVGKFELTIDGKKETGTKVFNGAAIGIRTFSAENSNIDLGILLDEDKFKAGATLDIGTMCYLNRGDKVAMAVSGKIKVVSKSKIEFSNTVFGEYDNEGNVTNITVSGYISSN